MGRPKSAVYETMDSVLETLKSEIMREMRVATIAIVTRVDDGVLDAQPIIKEKINTKTGYDYATLPELKRIPYIAKQYPESGDIAVCLHLDRSVDWYKALRINSNSPTSSYLESGDNRHSLTDCIAIILRSGKTVSRECVETWKLSYTFAAGESINITELKEGLFREVRIVLSRMHNQSVSMNFFLEDGPVLYELDEGFFYLEPEGYLSTDLDCKIYFR